MNVDVAPVSPDDRGRLLALLELYVYDFSEMLDVDVGEDGRFAVPAVERYFGDPRCHGFLIRVDGKLAGFALLQRKSRLSGDEAVCDMAEFLVLRRFRRRGVGARAAAGLFDRFPGPWEVRERSANRPAIAFWRRAIADYTGAPFEDFALDDERWRGQVQRFDSRVRAARR
jgi:predicted acetyltransferase